MDSPTDGSDGLAQVVALPHVSLAGPTFRGRARLTGWQRREVEEVRRLVMTAPDIAELGTPRQAYLAGLLEGAAQNLLDIIDAITAPES